MNMEKWPLPEAWGWRALAEIAPSEAVSVNPSEAPDEEFNYLGLDAIASGSWVEPKSNLVKGREIKSTCIRFDERHVLYAKLRPYLNKVVVPTKPGIASTELIPLLPNQKIIRRAYLAAFLRTQAFVAYATQNSTGSRMPRIRMDALWETPIPIPFPEDPIRSLETQHRILARLGALFTELAEARALHTSIGDDIKQIVNAALRQLFDEVQSRCPVEKRLDEITALTSGGTPSRDHPEYFAGSIPWVKTGELKDGLLYDSEEHITQEAIENSNAKIFPVDTLLIAMYGQGQTRGRTGVLAVPAATNQACCAILPSKDNFEPRYLQFWFRYMYDELRRQSETRGGNQPNLNAGIIKSLRPPLPDLDKQRAVVQHLDTVQTQMTEMQRMQDKEQTLLAELGQAILAQAFRGEL